jgi:hypothetical protein
MGEQFTLLHWEIRVWVEHGFIEKNEIIPLLSPE